MEDANIKLSRVLSNTTGVIATKLIDGIIAGRKDLDRLITENYHGKLKPSKEMLKKALERRVTAHHKFILKQIKMNLTHLEEQIEVLDKEMDKKLEEYNEQVELSQTIPGVGKDGAKAIIAEIGTDMEVFPDEKHLSSWAGMSPGSNESVGKKKHADKERKQIRKATFNGTCLGCNKDERDFFQSQVRKSGSR